MIADFLNPFINFISANLLVIQIVSFLVSSALLVLIVYFIARTEFFSEPIGHFFDVLGTIDISKRRTLKAWKQIQKRLKLGTVNQLKLAVLEADRILDGVLRMAGFPGKNMDERLEQIASAQISNIEEIKQTHKFRNRIATEPDLMISLGEAQITIEIYKKAFEELNLIE